MCFVWYNIRYFSRNNVYLRGTAVAGPVSLTFPENMEGLPLIPVPLPAVFPSMAILAGPREFLLFKTAGLSPPSVCLLLLLIVLPS